MSSTPTAALQSQAFFFNIAKELFCQLDADGRVMLVNPTFRTQLGNSDGVSPDATHNLIVQACIAEDSAVAEQFFGELRHRPMGETASITLRCQTRDGEVRWLEWVAQRAEDDTTYLVGTDVSADKAVQQLNDALEERNRDLQEFVFVSSHDLQEPVRKIRAFGDRLKYHCSDDLDAKALDYLDRMDQAGERMQRLIGDLLSYSRVSSQPLAPATVKLDRLVADTLVTLELAIAEQGAAIDVEPLPQVQGDASQLRQLFQNLISNALKFVAPGDAPHVTITSESASDADCVQIVVADRGIGVDAQYASRVFSPFQRLHNRQQYAGTGIGLAIARKVVTRHGGTIWLEPNPGGGTRAVLTLRRRVVDLTSRDYSQIS